MLELGYDSWGLISIDANPAAEQAYSARPPMLTTVALDKDSSLVFQLASPSRELQIRVNVTAMSAERCGPNTFRVFTGPVASRFRELRLSEWEKTSDGPYTVFTARVRGADQNLKLVSTEENTVIVSGVQFLSET